jgi:WhiB family transcriptional regulator, redox-sensing transcriptional regulator
MREAVQRDEAPTRRQQTITNGALHRAVPEDWFIDPVELGVPGVRREAEDDGVLGWQSDALCAETDPEAFFPEKGGSTRDAKRICELCEVKVECLEYALQNDERFGIWGGLSERERRKLRKLA